MTIHKLKSIKILGVNTDEYVGSVGTIFYDDEDGALRLSDGETLGGILLSSGTGTTGNTLVNGNFTVSLNSTGKLILPAGGDITDSTGTSVLGAPTVLDGGNASTVY